METMRKGLTLCKARVLTVEFIDFITAGLMHTCYVPGSVPETNNTVLVKVMLILKELRD